MDASNNTAETMRARPAPNIVGTAAHSPASASKATAPVGDMMTSASTMSMPALHASVRADSGFTPAISIGLDLQSASRRLPHRASDWRVSVGPSYELTQDLRGCASCAYLHFHADGSQTGGNV